MLTVVVLPFVPVTVSHGAAPVSGRIRQASSTSPQTGMPAASAATRSGLGGPPARRGDDEVDGPVRHTGGMALAEAHVDPEDVQDAGPLVDQPRAARLALVDHGDGRPAVGQGVGRGEPADAQAGDEHPQPGPVRVAVGQARSGFVAVGHAVPTTHSA